ncbi:uncharacterized protein LOC113561838 [Ooceraea biroi]|uniref:uncharacterized protein LOC113561838 n=1 Tax=Ooceraea biroi TaxID=2015173 RepID=UPI000F08F84C|nr:uncharacterized protein LOC113561838 [Ooceraea biroi]
MGLDKTRVRYTNTGALLIEVGGPDNKDHADNLAVKLREILRDGARVAHPTKMVELRFVGLDDSVTSDEVAQVIATVGECTTQEVRVGQIKPMRNRLGIVWAQCPLTAAIKVANQKKICLGWMMVKAELMKAKPLKCYRCLEVGHVAQNCTRTDRKGICYRCSTTGHRSADCLATPYCVLCKEAGVAADHRIGSAACHQSNAVAMRADRRNGPPDASIPTR